MTSMITFVKKLALFSVVIAAAGCSGGGSDGPGGSNSGTVTSTWSGYCVATFIEEYPVEDFSGEGLFTAHVGEQYLMSSFVSFAGHVDATLLYLTPLGLADFRVSASSDASDLPFVSNCNVDDNISYYAVFADVSVYAAEDLTTKLCDLTAGAVLPRDSGSMAGYTAVSFNFSGNNTYEVYLNAFGAQCGGAEVGYVSVPSTKLFGATTWLVPIHTLLGPG